MSVTPNEIFYYRPAPCPACDADCMESWLEDMAAEGLLLSADGFFLNFGIFYRRQPKKMTYRLIPAAKPTSLLWDEDNGNPDQQEQADRERYGWEYLTRHGDFHIYRSESPYASDLPTDRETREESLKRLTKRYRSSVFSSLLTGAVATSVLEGKLLQGLLYLGTWRSLFILAVLLSFLLTSVSHAIHYSRLRRRIREDDWQRRETVDWRSRALRHHLFGLTRTVSAIAMVCMLLSLWAASTEPDFLTPTVNYPGDPPFAAVADLAAEGQSVLPYTPSYRGHGYRVWSDLIAPLCVEWDEAGTLYSAGAADDSGTFITLSVDYFDTAAPWLARAVAWEFWWGDRLLNRRYQELEIPSADELGVDYAIAYTKRIDYFPTVILQKGTRIYLAYFSLNEGLDLRDTARRMAAALQ